MSGAGNPRDISVIGRQTVSADSPIKSQDVAGRRLVVATSLILGQPLSSYPFSDQFLATKGFSEKQKD
jgi:hypothetical protein